MRALLLVGDPERYCRRASDGYDDVDVGKTGRRERVHPSAPSASRWLDSDRCYAPRLGRISYGVSGKSFMTIPIPSLNYSRNIPLSAYWNALTARSRSAGADVALGWRWLPSPWRNKMLRWAIAFFIIAVIAAIFGFAGIAVAAAGIAKVLFFIFLVLFLVALLGGLTGRSRV